MYRLKNNDNTIKSHPSLLPEVFFRIPLTAIRRHQRSESFLPVSIVVKQEYLLLKLVCRSQTQYREAVGYLHNQCLISISSRRYSRIFFVWRNQIGSLHNALLLSTKYIYLSGFLSVLSQVLSLPLSVRNMVIRRLD